MFNLEQLYSHFMVGDMPTYLYDMQFWLALFPIVVSAFILGYIWRVRPRHYLTFWRPSALDPTLGQVSDNALASLSKAIKLTPEAIHTYMGLGNLYRSRGEFNLATRIHQEIAKRDDIPKAVQLEAIYQLALDHTSAGLMDRAEQVLRRVLRESSRRQQIYALALEALAKLLERQRRWADALSIRQKLASETKADPAPIAHLLVKIAESHMVDSNHKDAIKALQEALNASPECIPAIQLLAKIYLQQNKPQDACTLIEKHATLRPRLFHLMQDIAVESFTAAKQLSKLKELWRGLCIHPHSTWQTAAGFATWLNARHQHNEALDVLTASYDRNPTVIEAAEALGRQFEIMDNPQGALTILKSHLGEKGRRVMLYRCNKCGYGSRTPFWHCQQCHAWDSLTPIIGA